MPTDTLDQQPTNLPTALRVLGRHIESMESGSSDAALILQAADEIARLRTIIRVNGLRAGATHAEIDAVVFPSPPSPTGGGPIHD
jgi:hypothetical protein